MAYPLSVRCFSPERIPGVSTMDIPLRTSELVCEHWKRLRNALPNLESGRNCFLGSTTKALPGTTPSASSCMTAINRSVVGSGPIRIPGKSCSRRYRMKVVLPVEYWPTSMTIGRASKSASWKKVNHKIYNLKSNSSWYLYCFVISLKLRVLMATGFGYTRPFSWEFRRKILRYTS